MTIFFCMINIEVSLLSNSTTRRSAIAPQVVSIVIFTSNTSIFEVMAIHISPA